jgi:transcriptional regulator with XRE-family HTH domain
VKCPHCDGTGELADDQANVGAMILLHRKAAGMTQQDLASQVGLSRPQIANIEVGRSDMPVSRLLKFAAAFGVSMKDLIPAPSEGAAGGR